MAEQPIRVGFIGAGDICRQRHLPGLKKLGGVEFVAVCNRSEASSRSVAQDWGFAEVMSDWRELVERDDLDAVFIGTWPYRHREMSVAALDAGKHVFCQARMCMNLAEAEEMVQAARRHPDLVNMVCPPPHRMPWEPAIRRMIDEGELGDIREVEVRCLTAANADPDSVTWREQKEYSGLQALQVGIWAETLNAWVGEYRELSAVTAIPMPHKRNANGEQVEIQIPQIIGICGTLRSGAVITEHHSGLALHEPVNAVTIFGARGTLRVDIGQSIRFGRAGEPLKELDVPAELLRDWRVEEDFITAIRAAQRGESWSVSPDFVEAMGYMRKVQAIYDAAQSGQAVTLEAGA